MTIQLSIAQARALVNLLPTIDDRRITMYQKENVLVVDPDDPRGTVVDDRTYYISTHGVLSNEFVRPIATPEAELVTPPSDTPPETPPSDTPPETEEPSSEEPPAE